MRFIELSHDIEDGMITYRGLPAPLICDHISRAQSQALYAPGTTFQIGRIEMTSHTGTYIDAPFHRFAEGDDLSALDLQRIADLPGLKVEVAPNRRAIDRDVFDGLDVSGHAVLIATGWDRLWRTDAYFEGHPFLTAAAALALRDQGATLVGIDSLNLDDTMDATRPAHTLLLGAGVPIVEHLRGLDRLPRSGFRFTATPPRIVGMGTFPIRAYARVEDGTDPRGKF